jgi:phenylpropionate dioxygenase-like ring-hydroxylating dioxygenase large terminal subunit
MNTPTYQPIDASALAKRARPDRIEPSLYYDPNLFEAELDRIFYKTWIWVAHESELPNPGDFVTTTIGRQPVIVVRDKSGAVNVLQNRCRHRGATVCEAPKGNAKGFTCPYHSWSYALDGTLRALPYGDGYEGVCDKGDLPLKKLRVGVYHGLVFASFNEEIESLDGFPYRLPRARNAHVEAIERRSVLPLARQWSQPRRADARSRRSRRG